MAVSIVSANVASASAIGGPTFSFTATGSTYVVVFVIEDGTPTSNTVTVNGVSATQLFTPPGSGGGFTGLDAYGLVSPTSGNIVVTLGNAGHHCVAIAVPLTGLNTASPFGTWVLPGNVNSATPSTGTITGVDSTGLFLGVASIFSAVAVSAEGSGYTLVSDLDDGGGNIRAHVASAPGGASSNYAPTLASAQQVNVGGVYVNAASGGGSATTVVPPISAQRNRRHSGRH